MKRKLFLFLGGSLLLWALTALPAWLIWGEGALMAASVALGLCLVPMALTLIWIQLSFSGAPENQLLAALGSTGIRMAVVIVGAILLYMGVPQLGSTGFLLAVVGYYLATLALEIGILVGVPKKD